MSNTITTPAGAPRCCRWCREPLQWRRVTYTDQWIWEECIRAACVRAGNQALGQRRYAHDLSRQRPENAVVACLPGMHEPYGYTPPGQAPTCRHCGAEMALEETA